MFLDTRVRGYDELLESKDVFNNLLKNTMLINMKKIIGVLVVALVLCVAGLPCGQAQAAPKKRVLIINSYHQGLSWTDDIVKGIASVLLQEEDGANVELYFEYMDTKRYYGERYFQKLHETFVEKYSKKRFDVLIVADNDALMFIQKYYASLFPNTPVVFCGINNYTDSMIRDYPSFTGVVEDTDINSTIELVLKLHPRASEIVVVSDKTTTGIAMKKEVLAASRRFEDNIDFVFLEDFDMGELRMQIQEIPSDSIILLTVVNRDRLGNFFAYEESLKLIYQESKVPIYSFWEFYLGKGIVGGMLTSGLQQGKAAGSMARRILNGEAVSKIPVLKKSPNLFMFDFREIERFHIKPSSLPTDSTIINKPDTFYFRYKNTILVAAATIFVLTIVIMTLLVNISLRKRYETALKESEEKYRDLYDNAPDMYHSINREGIIIDCNETEARMLGYKKEEVIGRPIADFQTTESLKTYRKEFPTLPEHKALFGLEREYVRKDGTTFPATLNVFIEVDEKGELVRTKAIARDMTERKQVEKALRRSREELRSLSAHIELTREEERRYIAQEIHDELGQILSKLKLDISWLKKRLSGDQAQLADKADKMSGLVDSTIRTVQRISSQLRPDVLDHLGLAAAIEWQAKEFREQTNIKGTTTIDPDIEIEDQNIAIAVFRTSQEALTNIMRHANAKRADIILKKENNTLILDVQDSGIGISEDKISNHTSFGLMGMRERARFLGGKVYIASVPGKGTRVTVHIPLTDKENS
jgi:PAS domain S-box-containing protein